MTTINFITFLSLQNITSQCIICFLLPWIHTVGKFLIFTLEDRVGKHEKKVSLKDCYQDVSDRGRGGLEGGSMEESETCVIFLIIKKSFKKDVSYTVKKN